MSLLKTFTTALCLLLSSAVAHAGPFGLEIGSDQLGDVKAAYQGHVSGQSKWTDGPIYKIEPSSLGIAGLSDAFLIFDKDETLTGLVLSFNKNRFASLNKMAAETYTLVTSDIPFVGDKYVKYLDGDTTIKLTAEHMGFEMLMTYSSPTLESAYKSRVRAIETAKKAKEQSALFGKN